MGTITIEAVKRVVNLLKKANGDVQAHVFEIAREMNVKKTDLTEFILLNPDLFNTKTDKKGLAVREAYSSPEQNPYTQAWLDLKRRTHRKTLYVTQWDCYGQLEEYFVKEDSSTEQSGDHSYYDRPWLWRNTPEKMKEFIDTGHFHQGTGSTGMWSGTTLPHCLSFNEMKALVDDGWTLEGTLPETLKEYQLTKHGKTVPQDSRLGPGTV